MIKFDLEKALAGEKVITRNGEEVTQIVKFNKLQQDEETIYAVIDYEVRSYHSGGVYDEGVDESTYDLFMAPNKLSGFINVFADRDSSSHKSLDRANQFARKSGMNRIACIDLSQFEEGY